MHSNARSLAAGFAVCLALAACTSLESEDEWAGSTEILPDGVVRVTNPATGIWERSAPWRLVEEAVIGEMDGDGPAVFGSISAIAVDSAGRIFVLDRQSNELRIFGPAGDHIRSVGRSGEGPGEYSTANGLAWLDGDSLLVIDQEGNRYTVLTRDGEYVRSVPRNLGFFGWVFSGGYYDGRVYEVFSVGQGDDRHPALLGTSLSDPAVYATIETVVGQNESPPMVTRDTILLPEPDAPLYESFSIRTDRGGMVIGVPFSGRPVYYLDRAGNLRHGHGSIGRVFHSTLAGDTLSEILLTYATVPVTADEVDEWEASPSVERFRTLGGKLEMDRIPKEKPYYDDMFVDDDGNTWLALPAGEAETAFAVLDPDGRYLGRLHVDGIVRDPYVRTIVHRGRLYWVGTDELDIQRVYVHRIDSRD